MGQTTHTPIRARQQDGYLRLLAVAGPILCDVLSRGATFHQTRILPGIPSARKHTLYDQLLTKSRRFLFQYQFFVKRFPAYLHRTHNTQHLSCRRYNRDLLSLGLSMPDSLIKRP